MTTRLEECIAKNIREEAEKAAAEALPCQWPRTCYGPNSHWRECPAFHRPAATAALVQFGTRWQDIGVSRPSWRDA